MWFWKTLYLNKEKCLCLELIFQLVWIPKLTFKRFTCTIKNCHFSWNLNLVLVLQDYASWEHSGLQFCYSAQYHVAVKRSAGSHHIPGVHSAKTIKAKCTTSVLLISFSISLSFSLRRVVVSLERASTIKAKTRLASMVIFMPRNG